MFKRNLEVKLVKPPKGVELRDDEEDGIDRIAYYCASVNNAIKDVAMFMLAYKVTDSACKVIVNRLSK